MYCKILKAWTDCNPQCLIENCLNAKYTAEIFGEDEEEDEEDEEA